MGDKQPTCSFADTELPPYYTQCSHNHSTPADFIYQSNPQTHTLTEIQTVQDPRLVKQLKRYRLALFVTWFIALTFFIYFASYVLYTHHTLDSSDTSDPTNTTTTTTTTTPGNTTSTRTMHALDPQYTPYQCITGFTSEQMHAAYDWLHETCGTPDRWWPEVCANIPGLADAAREKWNFQVDS